VIMATLMEILSGKITKVFCAIANRVDDLDVVLETTDTRLGETYVASDGVKRSKTRQFLEQAFMDFS
jgi:hypothetical protein